MWRTDLFRTATFRLTLAVVGAMIGAMVLQFGLVYVQMTHFEERRSNDLLQREAYILSGDTPARLQHDVSERTTSNLRVVINGAAVFDSGFHYVAGDLKTWPEGLVIDGQVHQLTVHPPDDDPYDMRFLAIRMPDDRILVLARSLHMLDELRYMTRRAVWISIVPIVAFSLMTGIILSHRALARVGEMHEAIERIMGGDLHERLPAGRERDELERLAGSVNRMLDRLEHLLDEIRDVGNDIAHDLRTPLTRARARMERALARPADAATLGQALSQAQGDLDQCFSVITALLRIGEIENGRRRAGFGPVSLPDLVADIVDLYDPIAETEGLTLLDQVNADSGSPAGLSVYGDRDLLIEVLANLIDNAIKFTPPGGTVGIAAERRADRVMLRVFDTGIGIAENERGAVLGRFYRSDKSRHVPGSGLGLSLVSAILRLHDATLSIAPQSGRAENPGTVFEIAFPGGATAHAGGDFRGGDGMSPDAHGATFS